MTAVAGSGHSSRWSLSLEALSALNPFTAMGRKCSPATALPGSWPNTSRRQQKTITDQEAGQACARFNSNEKLYSPARIPARPQQRTLQNYECTKRTNKERPGCLNPRPRKTAITQAGRGNRASPGNCSTRLGCNHRDYCGRRLDAGGNHLFKDQRQPAQESRKPTFGGLNYEEKSDINN